MLEGEFVGMGFGLSDIKFVVVDVMPKQAVLITDMTELTVNPEPVEVKEVEAPGVSYEDIDG